MSKQFAGAKVTLASGAPLEELRFGKGRGLALDQRTGEFNASDKRDLAQQIGNMMIAMASGEIVHSAEASAELTPDQDRQNRFEVLSSALNDETGKEWAALGSGLAQKIHEQADREGFLRNIAQGQTLKQGDQPRVPMPQHDVIAVVATSAANVGYQTLRQKVFMPEEFEIVANVRVHNLDLEQINGDLLEEAYNQGLEAIMVQEDRLWKQAADKTVGIVNPLEYIAGELTPKNLGALRQSVARWHLPTTTAIISNDYWADIIGSNDFATMLDPITKYDLVMNGQLGTLVGLNLITDAFRQQNQKVLNEGEIYIVSEPHTHAAYSTRGGIRSRPTDGANEGNSTRGWYMTSPFSFVLANSRSVAKGRRV